MKDNESEPRASGLTGFEIGVIGMSGRFPGAGNIEEFWENLKNGTEGIAFFTDEELKETGVRDKIIEEPRYIKAYGWLDKHMFFDAAFFGYTPLEAEVMDPQMRLFHECTYEALEDAGYDTSTYKKPISLYAGASANFSWQARVGISGKANIFGWFAAKQLTDKDFLGTRTAYKLNLKGPAVTVDSACSTSLTSIHLAIQGLLSGDCDMALAGGVSIAILEKYGYLYQEGMISSSDGHCRAFDAKADGSSFGNAIAVVVLKRYEDAVADRDNIYAMVKGSAINNDGNRKAAYTAPSIEGQSAVIRSAHQMAEVDPETITYIETHGTGTTLGDPVEIEGLKAAFNTKKKHFCRIGSVKSNVGHLEMASGVTGFIKTILALKHKQIPPSLYFETPNAKIDFVNSPFVVNIQLTAWQRLAPDIPLRAGVSSFGIGGTNAHVILEEAPEGTRGLAPLSNRQYQLILLSAKTAPALEQMTQNLAHHFQKHPDIQLADAAYTLQVGRQVFPYRRMLVCPGNDTREAVNLLSTESGKVKTYKSQQDNRPIIFMFSGLGAQYVNMGRDLYQHEPLFRSEMDRCFEILESLMGFDIKEILYPHPDCRGGSPCPPKDCVGSPLQSDRINQTEISQVVVFIFEYALAQLLMAWGIKPYAMIGYSFGEYTAACVSGVFSLEDALKLVVSRGQLLRELPEGVMLSVPLLREEINSYFTMDHEISLAIDNGPSCVIAGPPQAVDLFEKQVKKKKVICVRIPAARAIHSPMMDPILEEFAQLFPTLTPGKPKIPYVSNVTGDWVTDREAASPAYWAKHLRETVQFAKGMKTLLKVPGAIFVEIGPGRDISTLALRHLENDNDAQHRVSNLVRPPHQDISDVYFLLNKIGRLWLYGQPIDWDRFYGEEKKQRQRISLPTYPFEGQRYWIENTSNQEQIILSKFQVKSRQTTDFNDWFYIPSWTRSLLLPRDDNENPGPYTCLVFIDGCGLGAFLLKRLQQEGHEVITIEPGTGFVKKSPGTYVFNPRQPENYSQLFQELGTRSVTPFRILHLWGVTGTGSPDGFEQIQDSGFYSLLYIAKAIGREKLKGNFQIDVVTDQLQEVTGEEVLCPAKATVIGAVRVIPQEYPGIRCRCIDVLVPEPGSMKMEKLAEQLLEEMLYDSIEPMVAYRHTSRWVQTFNPLKLDKTRENHLKLRENGVYLISGGLGNIGLMLADYLARKVKAKLILTGRAPMPPRQEWEQWLKDHDETDTFSQKIKKLKIIENAGAEIRIFSVDTADKEKTQTVITRAENELGPINGVIHAAGIMKGKSFAPIQQLEIADCQEQFRPKVKGLLILEELFRDREPDFCWLLSSISVVLGGLGITAYAAANSFMDALAKQLNRSQPGKWISVDWDGMDIEKTQVCFERILSLGKVTQAVASNGGNLQQRIEQWVKLETLKKEDKTIKKELKKRRPRPGLMNLYVPPQGNLQQTLANIWQNLLGFEQIGIHDDFIELGGDSLKAINMINHVHKKLEVSVSLTQFFKKPTIENLHQCITRAEKQTYHSIEPLEKREYYLLSSMQKRLYILHQMDPGTVGYNLAATLVLEGEPPGEKLQECFHKLIQRHESLRISFHMIRGQPVQKVHDPTDMELNVEYYDLNTADTDKKNDKLQNIPKPSSREPYKDQYPGTSDPESQERRANSCIKDFIRPFALSRAPLLRVGLIKENQNRNILVVDMHHIVHDGISQTILLQEFKAFYTGEELPALNIRYKDFARWQNRNIQGEAVKKQEIYWLQQFAGEIPVLDLPYDYPRPMMQSFAGATANFIIDPEKTNALRTLALSQDATLFMVILSIYYVFLAKLSTQEDIVVGTPEAGRNHPDLQSIIGFFLHTLALRNYPTPDKTFNHLLKQLKERTLQAFENHDYPFEELVERVAVNRDMSRSPLFDVMFILHTQWTSSPGKLPRESTKNMAIKSYDYEKNTAEFDLTLIGFDKGEHLLFKFEYCTKLFKAETIHRFIDYFKTLLVNVLKNHSQRLHEIEMIPKEEKKRLLYDFNDTALEYPGNKTIHQLFADQVEKIPDHIALVGSHEKIEGTRGLAPLPAPISITYRELNEKSHQLACLLIEKGVKLGTIVGILVERSIHMIIGLLCILKAGAAYLPLDPEYPWKRINYILGNSTTKFLVTTPQLQVNFKAEVEEKFIETIDISNLLSPSTLTSTSTCQVGSASPAYVIYTSGSTGNPKGVVIPHQNAVNFISAMTKRIRFSTGKTIAALTTISFDIFFLETFLPLTCGLRVVIAAERHQQDPAMLRDIIARNHVDILQVTPSRLKLLLSAANQGKFLEGVETLIVGGEAFPGHLLEQVKETYSGNIYNVYGPTETTIWSTLKDLTHSTPGQLTIGTPIANTQVYIVDRQQRLQPQVIAGELLIGGDGVASGYLNNPDLTAEKFINYKLQIQNNPEYYRSYRSYKSYVLYRTGDLARWLPDGEIEFLGRIDHQVKIRGFRIELEEIEEQLVNHEHIKEAVVISGKNKNGDNYLAAYLVPTLHQENTTETSSVSTLREYLSGRLPDYMIPSYFVHLEQMPVTPNGKINRKALPEPIDHRPQLEVAYLEPESGMEKIIAQTWKEELELEKIGVNDNFFDLGGSSMTVVRLINRLNREFNKNIPVVSMFKHRTIRTFSEYMTQEQDISLAIEDRGEALKRGEQARRKRFEMRKGGMP